MAKKTGVTERDVVVEADAMDILTFIRHCWKRHPDLPYRGRREHAQEHRLFPARLDHTHPVPESVPEPEPEVA